MQLLNYELQLKGNEGQKWKNGIFRFLKLQLMATKWQLMYIKIATKWQFLREVKIDFLKIATVQLFSKIIQNIEHCLIKIYS